MKTEKSESLENKKLLEIPNGRNDQVSEVTDTTKVFVSLIQSNYDTIKYLHK